MDRWRTSPAAPTGIQRTEPRITGSRSWHVLECEDRSRVAPVIEAPDGSKSPGPRHRRTTVACLDGPGRGRAHADARPGCPRSVRERAQRRENSLRTEPARLKAAIPTLTSGNRAGTA